jgi:hypothetical protein
MIMRLVAICIDCAAIRKNIIKAIHKIKGKYYHKYLDLFRPEVPDKAIISRRRKFLSRSQITV